jgi:ComEC/Rec2-related protein
MVISGSHIGLIAGFAYLLVIRIWAWTSGSPHKIAALTALLIAVFYSGLTGFSVPAQRSALMVAIGMIAIIQQRNTSPYHIRVTALLAVLLIDPLVVLPAGFWLSFIAVSLIIYIITGRLGKLGALRGALKINWVTSLGLSPLLLFFFSTSFLNCADRKSVCSNDNQHSGSTTRLGGNAINVFVTHDCREDIFCGGLHITRIMMAVSQIGRISDSKH